MGAIGASLLLKSARERAGGSAEVREPGLLALFAAAVEVAEIFPESRGKLSKDQFFRNTPGPAESRRHEPDQKGQGNMWLQTFGTPFVVVMFHASNFAVTTTEVEACRFLPQVPSADALVVTSSWPRT
jgi:hypothetical protein